MCGRYAINRGLAEICALFGVTTALDVTQMAGKTDARPGMVLPLVVKNRLGLACWGWPHGVGDGRPLINIRAETVAQKPLFAADWRAGHRALAPATGFYERGVYMDDPSAPVMALCGVWTRDAAGAPCFAVLTRDAVPEIASIHARMPVWAAPDGAKAWLDGGPLPVAHAPFVKPLDDAAKVG